MVGYFLLIKAMEIRFQLLLKMTWFKFRCETVAVCCRLTADKSQLLYGPVILKGDWATGTARKPDPTYGLKDDMKIGIPAPTPKNSAWIINWENFIKLFWIFFNFK